MNPRTSGLGNTQHVVPPDMAGKVFFSLARSLACPHAGTRNTCGRVGGRYTPAVPKRDFRGHSRDSHVRRQAGCALVKPPCRNAATAVHVVVVVVVVVVVFVVVVVVFVVVVVVVVFVVVFVVVVVVVVVVPITRRRCIYSSMGESWRRAAAPR